MNQMLAHVLALPTAIGDAGTGFGQACEVASRVDNVMV